MLYLFLALMLTLGVMLLMTIFSSKLIKDLTKLHYEEKQDLFMKLTAKSLSEAEYFRKEYPIDVEEKIKKFEENRENPPSDAEKKRMDAAEQF